VGPSFALQTYIVIKAKQSWLRNILFPIAFRHCCLCGYFTWKTHVEKTFEHASLREWGSENDQAPIAGEAPEQVATPCALLNITVIERCAFERARENHYYRLCFSQGALWYVNHVFKQLNSNALRSCQRQHKIANDVIGVPKNPLVLAHGLFGFEELRLAGKSLPGFQYWRGIKEALADRGIETIITSVPPSGSIEARAARLAACIEDKAGGKSVNIIAYVYIWLPLWTKLC